jgi:ABC-type dipeptide/oligopeptide/nickel transport system ATPase component
MSFLLMSFGNGRFANILGVQLSSIVQANFALLPSMKIGSQLVQRYLKAKSDIKKEDLEVL